MQAAEQLAAGRAVIVELDAFHLPDTASTTTAAEHVKTSVCLEAIDLEARRLRYFHNAGYFELSGADYARFRSRGPTARRIRDVAAALPPTSTSCASTPARA